MTSKLWTLLLWTFRLALLGLLYVVLWRVVSTSLQTLRIGAPAQAGWQDESASVSSAGTEKEAPVVISLGHRAETSAPKGSFAFRLLVLDHPNGNAPRGKRDVYATGEEIPVYPPLRIGRMAGCDVVTRDRYSSGIHARLYQRGPSLHVEDLGSTNGTYVNGSRVQRKAPLEAGDVLQIGETSFLLKR